MAFKVSFGMYLGISCGWSICSQVANAAFLCMWKDCPLGFIFVNNTTALFSIRPSTRWFELNIKFLCSFFFPAVFCALSFGVMLSYNRWEVCICWSHSTGTNSTFSCFGICIFFWCVSSLQIGSSILCLFDVTTFISETDSLISSLVFVWEAFEIASVFFVMSRFLWIESGGFSCSSHADPVLHN